MKDIISKVFNPALTAKEFANYLNETLILKGNNDFTNVSFLARFTKDKSVLTGYEFYASPNSTMSLSQLESLATWKESFKKQKRRYELYNSRKRSIPGIIFTVLGGVATVASSISFSFIINKAERIEFFLMLGLVILYLIILFIGLSLIGIRYSKIKRIQNDPKMPDAYFDNFNYPPENLKDFFFYPAEDGLSVYNGEGICFSLEDRKKSYKDKVLS